MVPRDHHLRLLAHDVPPETDPRPTGKLQAQADRFPQRAGDALGQARRLQDDEQAARPTGECGKTPEPIRDARWPRPARPRRTRTLILHSQHREIDEQEIHRAALEQGAGDAEPLVQGVRREDDEPLQPDAARDGLHGIERAGEIQVRDDRTAGLRLGGEPQRERGLAAGCVAVHRDAGQARDPARPEDRVQGREARGHDPAIIRVRQAIRRPIIEREGRGSRWQLLLLVPAGQWNGREGADRGRFIPVPDGPRSCGAPASLEGRESGSDLGRGSGHRSEDRTDVRFVNGIRRLQPR